MKITATVHGLSDLAAALKALPAEVASRSGGPLAGALRAAAKEIANEAEMRAPKDTGRLASVIKVRRDNNPTNVTERMVVKPRRGKRRYDTKGAWYWHFVEFGTEKQPAQPFMRPAFDAAKERALAAFKPRLAAGIERAARKAARLGLTRGR